MTSTATAPASREVLASAVKVGDEITETSTPEGPFYVVAKVNAKSLVLDDDGFPIRLPFRATDQVRVLASDDSR